MKVSEIKSNPNNPRIIKDDKFKKLVKSLQDFPEMAEVRPVVINEDNVILGGNMRFKAMVEAGWKDIPVKKVEGWTEEQQRQFIIKDNVSGGEWDWDLLANEWDTQELDEWGLDLPTSWGTSETVTDLPDEPSELKTIVVVAYKNINDLDKITDFYHLKAIDLTDEMRSDISKSKKAYVFE